MKNPMSQKLSLVAVAVGLGLCVSCADADRPSDQKGGGKATITPPEQAPPVAEAQQTEAQQKASVPEGAVSNPVVMAWLKERFGEELVKADGTKVLVDSLAGKTLGIYFSAHWCGPCRRFTPSLVKAYNGMIEAGNPFEIVFVSSDRSKEAMAGYMKEMSMPWVAIPYGTPYKRQLGKTYGIRGIPTLVIVNKDGELITKNGRGDVTRLKDKAFDSWQ